MKKFITVLLFVLMITVVSVSFAADKMVKVTLASGKTVEIRESVKELLDEYEEYYNGTIDILSDKSSPLKSLSILGKSTSVIEKLDEMEDDFTDEETMYWLEVQTRVTQNAFLSL